MNSIFTFSKKSLSYYTNNIRKEYNIYFNTENDNNFYIENENIFYINNIKDIFTFNINLEFDSILEDFELIIYVNNKNIYTYSDDKIIKFNYSTIIPLKKGYFFNIIIRSKNLEEYNIIGNSNLIITN